jgi:NAD+ kinase
MKGKKMTKQPRNILLVAATGDQYQTAQRLAEDMHNKFERLRLVANGPSTHLEDLGERYDLAIAIGGDGTMMKTGTTLSSRGIPTLGVNAGDVGFLTSVNANDWQTVECRLRMGEFEIEERLGLTLVGEQQALEPIANEVVVRHKTSVAKYRISIDGQVFYQELMGDGVLVSTATGSTGYNTSAGGPILLPGSGNVVVTPLNPMSLSTRPIVSQELADGKEIVVTLIESKRDEPVQVIADGRALETDLAVGDSIFLSKYRHPLLFATFGLAQYARALTEKKGFAR